MANLKSNELAQKYCKGEIEVSHYGQMDDIDIRVRPDCKNSISGWISDVKTCQDNSPEKFRIDILKFRYDLQATFYCDALGYDPKDFRFIAVETNYPYSIEVYGLSDDLIELGRNGNAYKMGYKQALANWKFYKETDVALGYESQNRNEDGSIII